MKKVQLFCLPYAGGTAEVFKDLELFCSDQIEIVPLEYAGHGTRLKEDFYKNFNQMVSDMAQQINTAIREDALIAVFGYSMGSAVTYELLAQELLIKKPVYVFLAAHEAPGEYWESADYYKLDDLEFAHKMLEFGGFERFEEKLLKNKFFRKMIFNPIREDYRLIADYKLLREVQLDIAATIFFSSQDIMEEHVKKWDKCFLNKPDLVEIGENHFFLREHPKRLAEYISIKLIE